MTFTKGQPRPANAGRRPGSLNRATVRARYVVSEADDKAIINKLVEEAKTGNAAAIGLYLRYLRPPQPRETIPSPIDYMAPTTIVEAKTMVLVLGERLAKGELAVEVHDALVSGLRIFLADRAAAQQQLLEEFEAERELQESPRPS
jgi:hypothetical protein